MCGPSSNVRAMVPGTMHPVMATPTGMAGGACALVDAVADGVVDDGADEMDEDPTDDALGDPTDDSIDDETGDDAADVPIDDWESVSGDPADDWDVGMIDDVDCNAEGSSIDGADVSFAGIKVAIDSPEEPIDDSLDVRIDDKVDNGTDSPGDVVDDPADVMSEGTLDDVSDRPGGFADGPVDDADNDAADDTTDAANDDAPGDAFDDGAVDLDSDFALAFARRTASSLQRCIFAKKCLYCCCI